MLYSDVAINFKGKNLTNKIFILQNYLAINVISELSLYVCVFNKVQINSINIDIDGEIEIFYISCKEFIFYSFEYDNILSVIFSFYSNMEIT